MPPLRLRLFLFLLLLLRLITLLVMITLSLSAWLTLTPSGSAWLLSQVAERTGLILTNPTGIVASNLTLESFTLNHHGLTLTAQNVTFTWRPVALLAGKFLIPSLNMERLTVTWPARESVLPTSLPLLELPGVRVTQLVLNPPDAPPITMTNLTLRGGVRTEGARLEHISGQWQQFRWQGEGELLPQNDWPVTLRLTLEGTLPKETPLSLTTTLTGSLKHGVTLAGNIHQPFPALLTGTATELLAVNPAWRLQLRSEEAVDLTPYGWPVSVAGEVNAQGLVVTASLTARHPELGPWSLNVTGARQDQGWSFDTITGEQGESRVSFQATLPDHGAANLQGDWRNLAWPGWQSPQGRLKLHGTAQTWRGELTAELTGEGTPPTSWELVGEGGEHEARLSRITARIWDGTLTGSGMVTWAKGWQGQATFTAQGLDPGRQWPEWPGRIQAAGAIAGSGEGFSLQGAELSGTLRGQPLTGKGGVILHQGQWRLDGVEVAVGTARLQVSGEVAREADLAWSLNAPDLARVAPGWAGRLHGAGQITGTRDHPRVKGNLNGEKLAWPTGSVAAVRVEGEVDHRQESRVSVQVTGAQLQGERLERLELAAHGPISSHTVSVTAKGERGEARLAARGGWRQGAWQGEVTSGAVTGGLLPWSVERPAGLTVAEDRAELQPLCWGQGQARVCAGATWRAGQGWSATGQGRQLPVDLLRPWLAAPVGWDGAWQGDATLAGRAGLDTVDAVLTVPPGRITYAPPGREAVTIPYRQATFKGGLRRGNWTLSGAVELAAGDGLAGEVTMTDPANRKSWQEAPWQGRLSGHLVSLAVLSPLLQELDGAIDGRLELDVRVAGTPVAPRFQGQGSIKGGRLEVADWGVNTQDVTITAEAMGGGGLRITGSARSPGEGVLRIDGSMGGERLLDVRLTGERFLLVDLPETRLLVTPDLTLRLAGEALTLNGFLLIPEGLIEVSEGQGKVTASPDVVIKGRPLPVHADAPATWKGRMTSRVLLRFGEAVRFKGYGLEGRLGGGVTLDERPGKVTVAQGELTIADGRYEAFGQELTIEEGRLLFAGGPVSDPGVALKAVRETDEAKVGFRVAGPLRAPALTLFSDPALPEDDVLALLLLGHTLEQESTSNQQQGRMLYDAALSLGVGGGNLLTQKIRKQFGLDTLEFQSGGTGDDAAVSIGAHLSPKLYVEYGMGLVDREEKRLKLRYQLGENWRVESESGKESGADVLFSIER